ncbi:hypothetical protein UlMin_020913 [Ulmus minor]
MELLPIKGNITRYWRRRKYQRLDGSKGRKKAKIIRIGGAPTKRWRVMLRTTRRLRIKIGVLSPLKLWAKLKNAYINMMVNLAGTVGYLSTDNVFGAKRIPTSKSTDDKIVYSGEEVERRLVLEIYKALQIISPDHQ